MVDTPLKAFLSHSTLDRELASRIAVDLRSQGVDVWYQEWEMKGGDSIRRKVDEGIESALQFLVLLTPHSLRSEWVQIELDAGLVRKIQGCCRLIPILSGIEHQSVPPTLQGLLHIRVDNDYAAGLRKLIETCHNVDLKPTIGSPPEWSQGRPLPKSGLSLHAQRLAALLNQSSKNALRCDTIMSPEEIASALKVTEDEIAIAADELDGLGWVELRQHIGMGKVGFSNIWPTSMLFWNTDRDVKGWDTVSDAKELATVLVNSEKDASSLSSLDTTLKWGPRRINSAASYLKEHHLALFSETLGSDPYISSTVFVNPRTRRFVVQGRL